MEVGSGGSGVGSTEPHRRRLDGAGREAQEPTSPAPKRKTSGGAGFAGGEAGTGENITIRPGRRVTLLTDTAELAVTESVYGPGEKGPDPHVHHEHTDAFIVVDGTLTFAFRDGSLEAPSGTFISVPPDIVHSFRNESAETIRFFNIHSPSCGFGDYLRGRNPGFDQHEPPVDGGGDPASVVVVRLPR